MGGPFIQKWKDHVYFVALAIPKEHCNAGHRRSLAAIGVR